MTQKGGMVHLPDEEKLKAQGGHPTIRPRDAATLILLRANNNTTEVLAGRRSEGHKFMPGVYVFPGGRRDRGDSRISVTGRLDPQTEQKLCHRAGSKMSPSRMRALAVTAIRETYEEVGLMIGKPVTGAPLPFTPDLSALKLVARAITPPGRIRRFDTRFFAAFTHELNIDMSHLKAGDELEALEWVDLKDLGRLKMPDITMAVLTDINDMLAISPQLSLEIPVPFYYMHRGKFVREEI
jgi:8-oxo-dGTP pyrophosphatase MutT (NUDIX family)